jgi:hypothetical protein
VGWLSEKACSMSEEYRSMVGMPISISRTCPSFEGLFEGLLEGLFEGLQGESLKASREVNCREA